MRFLETELKNSNSFRGLNRESEVSLKDNQCGFIPMIADNET